MISHRHRCIYVKVPKCASTTVLDWFATHGGGRHSFRPWWYGGLLCERIPKVTQAMNLHPDYATFSFVRNPYERFVSVYRYHRLLAQEQSGAAGPHPADYGTFREFAELCRDVLEDFGPLWGTDAHAFFSANGDREYGPGRLKLRHLGSLVGHARRQTDFLPDCNAERLFGVARANGDPLSFLGRVENMDADFERMRRGLGLPRFVLGHRNVSAPGAGRDRLWACRYDQATRRLVEDIYAADLDFIGCGFDDGRDSVAVALPTRPAGSKRRLRRRGPRTWPARVSRWLWALEIRLEACIRSPAPLRRMLRPLKRLRGLPT